MVDQCPRHHCDLVRKKITGRLYCPYCEAEDSAVNPIETYDIRRDAADRASGASYEVRKRSGLRRWLYRAVFIGAIGAFFYYQPQLTGHLLNMIIAPIAAFVGR